MNKETDERRMRGVELLGTLLKRPSAVLILWLSDIERPVNYDELRAKLDHRWAALNKEGPSESEVRAELDFLVGQDLLEMVEEDYRITPYGAEVGRDLSPRTKTRPAKDS